MGPHWEALCAAGLPDGAGRGRGPLASGSDAASWLDSARAAVVAMAQAPERLADWQREPLLSWLRAFAHEFPSRYTKDLGADGDRLIEILESKPVDINRYLKLRRIAAENLSRFL